MNFLIKIKILLLFLLIKFFSKIEKILMKNLEEYFSYLFFSSNHPSRIHEISQKLKSFDYWKKNNNNLNSKFFVNTNKTKNKIIFVGDSQAEYLSRIINNTNDILSFNSKSLWLGTSLVIGLNSDRTVQKMMNKINLLLKNNNAKDKIVIITLGTIDIRAIFYELLITKTVRNEFELLKIFTSGLDNFIEKSKLLLNKKGYKKIGIIEIFNSDKKGGKPKNYHEIKMIKVKNQYPTFGSINQRKEWTNKANKIIKKLAKKYNISFIPNQMTTNSGNEKVLGDGVHPTSKFLIQKINKNIFNVIN